MAYATAAEFKAYVGGDDDVTVNDDWLEDVQAAAEDSINDHCGRNFNVVDAAADPTSRSYPPRGDLVIVHDIANTTGLTVANDGATVASTDYQLEPLNGLNAAGATVPYHQIRLINSCWTHDGKRATVTVTTDQWGWPSVPDQVKQATLILGKDIAHIRQNRFGVAGFGEFGVVRVRDNPHVAQLLSRLRHPRALGIA